MTSGGKYKVVQLSSVHPSFDTRIFHKICKSLVKAGYDVDLIIQHPKDETKDGINIIALPVAKSKTDRLFKIIPNLFIKCLRYPANTIFHFHDPELLPVGIILRFFGYEVIYDVHEDVPKDIEGKEWIGSRLKKWIAAIVKKIELFGNSYFSYVIVVTKAIQGRFKGPNTELVQNFPILTNSEPDSKSKEANHLFYLGDITIVRGVKTVIESMDIVNRSGADIRFVVGGKFSPPSLKQELESEEGWKYVNYVGWVNRDEFKGYVKNSFAGIVTFHPIPNHIEAQPNKLFEYMYAGLPVIASDFPLWRKIVEENKCGILVDPMSHEEIAKAILWLYNNPDEAQRIGQNGYKVVKEKYNWSKEEEKLLKVYEKLSR